LLIHVIDLSHPRVDENIEAVNTVLKELEAYGKDTLLVFNKIDAVENAEHVQIYLKRFPGSVAISARTGQGVDGLVTALQDELASWRLRSQFRIPLTQSSLIAEIHRIAHVLELRYEGDSAIIVAHIPPQLEQRLSAFRLK
jgi:GTP-binding protein HflX